MGLVFGCFYKVAELIGAGKRFGSIPLPCILDRENKCAAVGCTAAAGIPVLVCDRTKPVVFGSKALQCCISSLFFRTYQTDLHVSFLQSKHLGTQHRCIRNTDKLEIFFVRVVARNDKKPGAIRRSMDV